MGLSRRAKRQRLVVLADFLEHEVKPALDGCKFDMNDWATTDRSKAPVAPDEVESVKEASECGFAACAAGWGLVCPQLRNVVRACREPWSRGGGRAHLDIYKLANAFGLTDDEVCRAFSPIEYRSGNPRLLTVVKRLREIAASEPESHRL